MYMIVFRCLLVVTAVKNDDRQIKLLVTVKSV